MVDARVAPKGSLENLSQQEIAKLLDSGQAACILVSPVRARCAQFRAATSDDARVIFEK